MASALRKWVSPVPEMSILHMEAENATVKDFRHRLEQYQPDVVALSAISAEAPGLEALLPVARRTLPKSFIVVGGPHATIFYDRVLRRPEVDAVVLGEGEITFAELIEKLQSGQDWRGIEGIAYTKDSNEVVLNPPRPVVENLDEIPYPAWDLIDISLYNNLLSMNAFLAAWPYASIFTSRACPFRCIYCHRLFGKRFRPRSAEKVVGEIQRLVGEFGVREIQVIDDCFNFNIERAKEICRGIIKSGIKIKIAFPNGIRGDILDDELIELLARAGTYCMTFAVETATQRLQHLIRKNLDIQKVAENMKKAFDAGIIPASFYMIGFPTETREEIINTIKFAEKSYALKASFWFVQAYPRMELYELAKKVNPDFDIDETAFKEYHYFRPMCFSKRDNTAELEQLRGLAYKRFYFRPWRMWNILKRYPKNRHFLKAIGQASRIWESGRGLVNVKTKMMRVASGLDFLPRPSFVPGESLPKNNAKKKKRKKP